ncbi:MAG: hypothetical protein RSD17_01535, partial [Oscillospiraceae bacterium]
MKFEKADFIQNQPKLPFTLPNKWYLKILINILVTAVAGGIIYYFTLPVFNFHAVDFYVFIGILAVIYGAMSFLTAKVATVVENRPFF